MTTRTKLLLGALAGTLLGLVIYAIPGMWRLAHDALRIELSELAP